MAAETQELEREIAAMESRLASVKVAVAGERDAWRKTSRPGKSGVKWRSAAASNTAASSTVPVESYTTSSRGCNTPRDDPLSSETMQPACWDALELAQHLQSQQLRAFAQVVIAEQIAGDVLLKTPPGKLRQLFHDVVASASDPNWKAFISVVSKLQRLQRRLEKLAAGAAAASGSAGQLGASLSITSPRGAAASSASLFPQIISPRVLSLTATAVTRNSDIVVSSDANGLASTDRQQQQQLGDGQRSSKALPLRKPHVHNQQLATCWNCGDRFPRSLSTTTNQATASKSLAQLPNRLFCSLTCQRAIESTDLRVASTLSARFENVDAAAKPPTPTTAKPLLPASLQHKHTHKNKSNSSGLSMLPTAPAAMSGLSDLLHVAASHQRLQNSANATTAATTAAPGKASNVKPVGSSPVVRRRHLLHGPGAASSNNSSCGSAVAPSLQLMVASTTLDVSSSQRHANAQSSVYRLDPSLVQTHTLSFTTCFLGSDSGSSTAGADTTAQRRVLLHLQTFISVQVLHHLGLTCRTWHTIVHDHQHPSTITDALWNVHLQRTWRLDKSDNSAFLTSIGVVLPLNTTTNNKALGRPRAVLRTLTRDVARVVVETTRVLVALDTWQLATPMTALPAMTLHAAVRALRTTKTATVTNTSNMAVAADLYEHIALVCTSKCDVVAICAQELVRPLRDDVPLLDVLQGIRSGTLLTITCRRLRLFSTAQWLPFDRWHELVHCRAVFDICWLTTGSNTDTETTRSGSSVHALAHVWRQRVLERTQRAMRQRLLSKESLQAVRRSVHERDGPAAALAPLEQFVAAMSHSSSSTTTIAIAATRRKRVPASPTTNGRSPRTAI